MGDEVVFSEGAVKLEPGNYTLPEINGEVVVSVDKKDRVVLKGKVEGKGKLVISNAIISITSYEGDLEVFIDNCWIVSPFSDKISKMVIRNSTFLAEAQTIESPLIEHLGLQLVAENFRVILTGSLESEKLILFQNSGELIICRGVSCNLLFGHEISPTQIIFLQTEKGQVEFSDSELRLGSRLQNKPLLISSNRSLIRLTRFAVESPEQAWKTSENVESQLKFDSCSMNGRLMEELEEKQEVVGDYFSYTNGKVYSINARNVLVDTQKAPALLQLPLEARYGELLLIQKQFKSGFPVRIRISGQVPPHEFILGRDSPRPCYLILRFSSKGWVEKTRGDVDRTLNLRDFEKAQSRSRTSEKSRSSHKDRSERSKHEKSSSKKSSRTSEKRSKSLKEPKEKVNISDVVAKLQKSKELRDKFARSREIRKMLANNPPV
nr:hypothetical protein pmam_112 [Pithovirus mammoth]